MNIKVKKYLKISSIVIGILALGLGAYTGGAYVYENKTDLEHQYNKFTGLGEFRGIKFGSNISENNNLIFRDKYHLDSELDSSIVIKVYTKRNDKLKLGDLPLDTITYHYYNEKFVGVVLTVNAKLLASDYIEIFENLYGKPDEKSKKVENLSYLRWEGKKGRVTVNVINDSIINYIGIASQNAGDEIKANNIKINQDRLNNRAKDL